MISEDKEDLIADDTFQMSKRRGLKKNGSVVDVDVVTKKGVGVEQNAR
jgi:hypothetical protein